MPFLTLNGTTEYLSATAGDTGNLDFTNQPYSLGGWFWFTSGLRDDKTLMCRFVLDNNGWELYQYKTGSINLRHHHAATIPPGSEDPRSGCYSYGWSFGKWWFMGLSRVGASAQFYRGDIDSFIGEVDTTVQIGGLIDPESCTTTLYIGTDPTFINDLYGRLWRPRAWFNRAITEIEWQQIWEKEVEWFRS
ncbi:unnamed protein product [marine sediment metagenome]|uniref:Uncharacterized protein n=1 Tax=marine sediment metagenome TaxID=412755 RepID=X1N352_9ZZZZ